MKWIERSIYLLAVVMLLIFCKEKLGTDNPIIGQVVDKYEVDNKCYITLEIETTPENYIGLDIGDEYEIN